MGGGVQGSSGTVRGSAMWTGARAAAAGGWRRLVWARRLLAGRAGTARSRGAALGWEDLQDALLLPRTNL